MRDLCTPWTDQRSVSTLFDYACYAVSFKSALLWIYTVALSPSFTQSWVERINYTSGCYQMYAVFFLPSVKFRFFLVNRRPGSMHLCLDGLLSSRLIKSGPRFSRRIGRIMSRFLSDAARMPEANLPSVSSQEGRLWIRTSCNVAEIVEGSWTREKMP